MFGPLQAATMHDEWRVLINPLFSDRKAKRLGRAFIDRYGLGDDFPFNTIRKGTDTTVATVRQEVKAEKIMECVQP